MKAAVVRAGGALPAYGDFPEPQAQPGQRVIRVTAAALTPLARLRASGQHYTTSTAYPFIAGFDGTGVTDDGRRVYFMFPQAPFGAMAERCVVDERQCVEIPLSMPDDVAAAIANPGMSSWAALVERARLRGGETVLVNGATGVAGRLAIQIAKRLGAHRVVATGRRTEALEPLAELGADATVELTEDGAALRRAFTAEFGRGVDVVLDYLWGPSAESIIACAAAGPAGKPIRYVQIGSVAAESVALPAAALRSSPLELLGSGFGSLSVSSVLDAIRGLFQTAAAVPFPMNVRLVPLSDVAEAWSQATDARVVFVP